MTTTINASPSNGLVQTADGSGILKVQSNGVTTNALAWVNFNAIGSLAIRSAYNVSSVTVVGTGQFRLNFTNALSDANYAVLGMFNWSNNGNPMLPISSLTTSATIGTLENNNYVDRSINNVAIFGN